ncbi:hypothetical protein BDY19DRAFT_978775 [Irpex rosettiformis]|uniref:Uncharacterized protein n=1 Tax=Irpex rosettiformis TaxID=378272 RepID=A0ACB8TMZ9_9APHY|nr:hypothetical protein BDY19DRAFT_978775 [Irpex rosettiformis]
MLSKLILVTILVFSSVRSVVILIFTSELISNCSRLIGNSSIMRIMIYTVHLIISELRKFCR